MNLGIIWKNGEIINHRSLLKILFNPILRCFGWQIASEFDENKFVKYTMTRSLRLCWALVYNSNGCVVEKKRRIV